MPGATPAPSDEPSRAPYFLCAGVLLLLAAQAMYYFPQLPERMASHFGGDGRPNGWTPREGFFGVIGFVVLVQSAAFLGLPRILGRIPTALINLPNKHYWLAPERKQQTLAYVQDKMAWLGAAILGMIACVNQLVIHANLATEKRLDNEWFLLVMAVFFVFTAVWIATLYRRLRLSP